MFLLAGSTFVSCNILDEEEADCAVYVSFKYDMNIVGADAFSNSVKSVTLYAFGKDGKLYDYTPAYESTPMFQNEINAFVDCVQTGKKLASHIDRTILTSKLMQGIYDSDAQNKEVSFID